ncbi:unnamed protein product [Paramecium pentaurelia]|uniref:Uncharacterized protein n=1 Tax=Paramecium pentaurelia TaxID=43138 RepID=A0A8S1S9Q5_9CILI|nr:unnamed protein product [Paramecium pentaurelia]
MFSSYRKKLFDQKLAEQQQNLHQQKELKIRQSRGQIDQRALATYLGAYIQMKQIEDFFYEQCTNQCIDIQNEWMNDKERQCLTDCNSKITKFVKIAKDNYANIDDDTKKIVSSVSSLLSRR